MNSTRKAVILLALAALIVAPFVLLPFASPEGNAPVSSAHGDPAGNQAQRWVAAAPGKVEPRAGEYRIGASTIGRIVEVAVRAADAVEAGDLLARLDDQELIARAKAALADAALKRSRRDDENAPARTKRRYDADDAVWNAELQVVSARGALDAAITARRAGSSTGDQVRKARSDLQSAEDQLARQRKALDDVKAELAAVKPTDAETALTLARSQFEIVQAALDQTRIRAPVAGTVIQVGAKLGETAAPAADSPLVVIGDLSALRVRAELDERDLAKVRVGQRAAVRADAFRDTEFAGKVTAIGSGLVTSRLTARGPRRSAEVDVLEVFVTLDGAPPLLSGQRVDVYFFSEDAAASQGHH